MESMVKVALVTGAAAGIGRACSIRLARDGVAIGVLDRDLAGAEQVAAEIQAEGGKATALQANVAERREVLAAVDQLRKNLGPVTIVVNNAGITGFTPFAEITDEEWDLMMAVNLRGTFIVTQVCLPDMVAAGWGRIINITSSGAQTGNARMAHYAASKGAMVSLTRSLAQELGPLGVTVNNIPPGSIMNTKMSEENKQLFHTQEEELRRTLPVRRLGQPEDIANACAWLASEASSYVTGQTIGVNGGRVVT